MNIVDAFRAQNSIEHAPEPKLMPTSPASPLGALVPGAGPASPAIGRAAAPAIADPANIQGQYYIEHAGKERRYYKDLEGKQLAFRADNKAVTTRQDDRATIGHMLDVVQPRGWTSLHVRGTAAFKQEAWIEAQARGLSVKGYEPSADDRRNVQARRAARQQSQAPIESAAVPAPNVMANTTATLAPVQATTSAPAPVVAPAASQNGAAPSTTDNAIAQAGSPAKASARAQDKARTAVAVAAGADVKGTAVQGTDAVQPKRNGRVLNRQEAGPMKPQADRPSDVVGQAYVARPTSPAGPAISADQYREAVPLITAAKRQIEVLQRAIKDGDSGPAGHNGPKYAETYARQELDKVWKNNETAYALKAQGLTEMEVSTDLTARRFDRIHAALDRGSADIRSWRSEQANREMESVRAASGPKEPSTSPKSEAAAKLSPSGKKVLAFLEQRIDTQMAQLSASVRADLRAHAAQALAKREAEAGPVKMPDTGPQRKRATKRDQVADSQPNQVQQPRMAMG